MALIKSYELKTGLVAPTAYHIVSKVDTIKRPCDDPDPDGIRPENSPNHAWKAGYYGKICVAIYASKSARDTGKAPIAVKSVYPTDVPYNFVGELETSPHLNFEIDVNSSLSIVDQAYEHLKTLPTWQDATAA